MRKYTKEQTAIYCENAKAKVANEKKRCEENGLLYINECPITGLSLHENSISSPGTCGKFAQLRKSGRKSFSTLLAILVAAVSFGQSLHADISGGATTRFRLAASAAVVYEANNGIEVAAVGFGEKGHHVSAGAFIGRRIYTSSDAQADGIIPYVGGAYTWHTQAAKAETLPGWKVMAGLRVQSNYGFYDIRITGGTFSLLFGYRF